MMDTFDLPLEIKSIDGTGLIEGLAAGIGDVDHGGDRFMSGAFTKSLAGRGGAPVPMLRDHDLKKPIGVWTEFHETADGLQAKGRIATDSRDGADAYALAKMGALRCLSVGYNAIGPRMIGNVREIPEAKLHEVSLVAIGMHGRTTIASVKSIASVGDLRDLLHDEYGFSTREAKAMAGAAWKARADHGDDMADIETILSQSTARIAAVTKGR